MQHSSVRNPGATKPDKGRRNHENHRGTQTTGRKIEPTNSPPSSRLPSSLIVIIRGIALAWLVASAPTPLSASARLADVRVEHLAGSRAVELFLGALSAHAAFFLLVAWMPVHLPSKPFLLRKLEALGRAVHARTVLLVGVALGFALAATEGLRDAPDAQRQRAHGLFALLQLAVLLGVRTAERARADALIALERQMQEASMLAWSPPVSRRPGVVAPHFLRAAFAPKFLSAERLPTQRTRKLLFVMNHQLGGLEIPLFVEYMHVEHGLFPRSLADHAHFYLPGWAQLLSAAGAVDGTRDNCAAVMRLGQPLLVFPGGGNEILKSKADRKYALKWRERVGFARMAMAHGYTLVPVAAAGLEDQLHVLADIPVGRWLGALGLASGARAELTLPLLAPVPAELGQRLYFKFLEPIDTAGLDATDPAAVRGVRDLCQSRLEAGLAELLREREADPERFVRGGGGGGAECASAGPRAAAWWGRARGDSGSSSSSASTPTPPPERASPHAGNERTE